MPVCKVIYCIFTFTIDDSVEVKALGGGTYEIKPIEPEGKVVDKVYFGFRANGEPSMPIVVDEDGKYIFDTLVMGVDTDVVFSATFKDE